MLSPLREQRHPRAARRGPHPCCLPPRHLGVSSHARRVGAAWRRGGLPDAVPWGRCAKPARGLMAATCAWSRRVHTAPGVPCASRRAATVRHGGSRPLRPAGSLSQGGGQWQRCGQEVRPRAWARGPAWLPGASVASPAWQQTRVAPEEQGPGTVTALGTRASPRCPDAVPWQLAPPFSARRSVVVGRTGSQVAEGAHGLWREAERAALWTPQLAQGTAVVRCGRRWGAEGNGSGLRAWLGARPCPTKGCRRRQTASAPLPLFAAPDPWR
jgi:hypothetical protein